jgi:hypothetical protein
MEILAAPCHVHNKSYERALPDHFPTPKVKGLRRQWYHLSYMQDYQVTTQIDLPLTPKKAH